LKRHRRQADGLCAIVPANVLQESKSRLAKQLDASTRSRLSAAMLLDILRTLQKVKRIRRVTVVSADFRVRRLVRSKRVHFLWEGKRKGLNKGVRIAIRDAKRRKFQAALIVPSDIPFVTPREITRFLHFADDYPVAVTPSKDGGGTNALLLRPPDAIGPTFGKNSFRKHLSVAKRGGFSAKVVRSVGLASDVDEPADLVALKRRLLRNETGRFVKTLNRRGASRRHG
jgi:2-phospho-L-lactate guanylyltransferase